MPPITVYCPFTRADMVGRFFDDLESTDLEKERTNLALVIDKDMPKVYPIMLERAQGYRGVIIIRNYEHEVNDRHVTIRRQRIAQLHEDSKELIANLDGEFVLGLEDDTTFKNLNVNRMWLRARADQVGFVSAYEAGRWFSKYIGIWKTDNPWEPKEIHSLTPIGEFEEIDAAGWYCFLTKKQHWLEATYETETWQPWGPDVNFGLELRRKGFKNYVDWNQPCGHYDQGRIIKPVHDLVQEQFVLDENPKYKNGFPQWVRKKVRDNV